MAEMTEDTDVYVVVDGVEVNVTKLLRVKNNLSEAYDKSNAECTSLRTELKKSNRLLRKYKETCDIKQKYINRFVSIFGKNWKQTKPIIAQVTITVPLNVRLRVERAR